VKEFLLSHEDYPALNTGTEQRGIDEVKMIGYYDQRALERDVLLAMDPPSCQ
jgi:hypothetical protein